MSATIADISVMEDKRTVSRLIRNQLPERVAGSNPVSSAVERMP